MFDSKELCTKRKKLQRSGAPLQDEMFNVYKLCDNKDRFRGAKWLYSEKMAYCSNIKYNTINMLFDRDVENVLYMDADAIVRKPLDELIKLSSNYDISMFMETDKGICSGAVDPACIPTTDYYDRRDNTTWVEWHAGLFVVRNNNKMKRFFYELEQAITDPTELYDWEADQVLFNDQYQKVKSDITVYSLPRKFKDEQFSDSSVVWCGAGEHKFQTERFIEEQQIYA